MMEKGRGERWKEQKIEIVENTRAKVDRRIRMMVKLVLVSSSLEEVYRSWRS